MTLLEDAAPEAANPAPIHDQSSGLVTLSDEMMTTRSARSLANQSSAMLNAAVAEAQATLMVELGPRIPVCWANWAWPMLSTWKRKRRSKRPSASAPLFRACSNEAVVPGKHEANTTPVRSRWCCGTCQPRMSRRPPLPTCSSGVSGMAASRKASKPDATASCVVMSHASTAFGSTPNSSARSKA